VHSCSAGTRGLTYVAPAAAALARVASVSTRVSTTPSGSRRPLAATSLSCRPRLGAVAQPCWLCCSREKRGALPVTGSVLAGAVSATADSTAVALHTSEVYSADRTSRHGERHFSILAFILDRQRLDCASKTDPKLRVSACS